MLNSGVLPCPAPVAHAVKHLGYFSSVRNRAPMQDCTLKLDAVNIFISRLHVRCQEKFFQFNAKPREIDRRKSGLPLKTGPITSRCGLRVNSCAANCFVFLLFQRYRDRIAGLAGLR